MHILDVHMHMDMHMHMHVHSACACTCACACFQESMALRLTDALGANTSLTRLSLASVGLHTAPATALGDALRRNGKAGGRLAHLDLRGNPLGSVATRQLLATLQVRSSRCPRPITCHALCSR